MRLREIGDTERNPEVMKTYLIPDNVIGELIRRTKVRTEEVQI